MAGMTGDGSRGSGSGGVPEEVIGDLSGLAGGVVLQAAVVDGSGAGAGNGGGGGAVGPCGACKFLRRKCVAGCIFSPYFRAEEGASYFAAVHKVFGASNVSKLLAQIPDDKRLDAVATICYEAQARLRDAVYGCTSHINALQQQAATLQSEVAYLQAQIAQLELRSPPPPHTATPPLPPSPPPFSVIFDIPPSPSTVSTTAELASIFSTPDDHLPWPPLIVHQQEEHPQQRPPQQEEQQQHIILELQQLLDGTGDGSSFIQNALEIRQYLQSSLANDLIGHAIHPPPSMSK